MPMFMLNGNQYGGNGGNYQVARMSKADYDALTDEQKNDGTLRIVADTAGNSVNYMSAQVAGAKTNDTLTNLLDPTLTTRTYNGVTCTANGDGTFTLNGTASGTANFMIHELGHGLKLDKGQTLRITGTPSEGNENVCILLEAENGTAYVKRFARDSGDGATVTISDEDAEAYTVRVTLHVQSGHTANNLLFKPMLTPDLQATYDDFVGYTGGTGRLNSDVAAHQKEISRINSELTDTKSNLSSNYMKYKYVTKTVTIPQNTEIIIDLSGDLPTSITRFEILSARLGGYVLPYIEHNGATHANITLESQSAKTIRIYSSTTAWTNYELGLVIGYF